MSPNTSSHMWLRLFFKVFFIRKCIKIIFKKKKLFLTSAHQNDLKTSKKYINLKQKKKLYFSKTLLKHKNKYDYYNYINQLNFSHHIK